jgi:catalase
MPQPIQQAGIKLTGQEYPPAEETAIIEEMIHELESQLKVLYPEGATYRQAHPKMHGCVNAEFIVDAGIPPQYQAGIFKPGTVYPALIRFSNASTKRKPDAKPDVRGMAIKLLNVPGEKLLTSERNASTQDFLLISHPIFVSKNIAQFHKTIKALTSGKLAAYFLNPLHWGVLKRSIQSFSVCKNVLNIAYWSTTPYQFGNVSSAVKYHVKPSPGQNLLQQETKLPDYLRANLADTLSKQDASFDFFIQFQTDAETMPVEDPTIEWKSAFIKLATIKIPQQVFDTDTQNKLGESHSFTPWHCLPAHRPLGGINRARKRVYEVLSAYRKHRNHVELTEPTLAMNT